MGANDMKRVQRTLAIFCLVVSGLTPMCFAAVKLTVSPSNSRQLSNSTVQFTAMLKKRDVSAEVRWRSSNPSVAVISRSGLATLLSSGSATITAARGSMRAMAVLTVTEAASPRFIVQPSDTSVSATINGPSGVKVLLLNTLGDPLASHTVTISIGTNPPGTGSLSGTLTRTTNSAGVATFADLKIDWLGNGYTLVATAAASSGTVTATSNAFNELRVGDACLGPDMPACSGTCPDADGDGLNDAWEIAGGVDLNGDGLITDGGHDLLLPGADPHEPDLFVQYDWMDYGPPGNACSADADCTRLGLGHTGETCSGPQLIPSAPASCQYACNMDSDCTSRSAFAGDTTHSEEKCQAHACVHTHDPSVTTPNALQAVVDKFAEHGINLHLIRGKAQPHSTVISFRDLNVLADSCEGGSLASGDAGAGKYAESIYDLKGESSPDKFNIAYHYTIFSHYSGCDSTDHCNHCPESYNPDGSPKADPPNPGQSGIAEISGNDFIVSLGNRVQDLAIVDTTLATGGTFMHELGHNLGLHHGGGIDEPCHQDSDCRVGSCTQTEVGKYCLFSDDTTWKPNILSVMNYRFQFAGIEEAVAVGSTQPISCSADSDCPSGNYCHVPPLGNGACARLDFSSQTLPTGGNTPGVLDESNTDGHPGLNEPAGFGSGTADITSYFQYDAINQECILPAVTAPTQGPVDFDGDGATTTTNATADLNGVDHVCGTVFSRLGGSTDWPELSGLPFTYGFQCTPYGGPRGDVAQRGGGKTKPAFRHFTGGELSPRLAMEAHVLYPPFSAKIKIGSGCGTATIAAGKSGTIQVALLGDGKFDVAQVEPGSLKFGGISPLEMITSDVNSDGVPDLLLTFSTAQMKFSPQATVGRLSGWLKNSQSFSGEAPLRVVSSIAEQNSACR